MTEFGVIHALLRAGRSMQSKMEAKTRAMWGPDRFKEILERERQYLGLMQRFEKSLFILDNMVVEDQNSYQGQSDCWLIHFKAAFYWQITNERNTTYNTAGPDGPRHLNEGPNQFTSMPGTNHRIYMVRNYDIHKTKLANPLTTHRLVGGYHLAYHHLPSKYAEYRSDHRSIKVMNGDLDTFSKVTLDEMLRGCGRINPTTDKMIGFDDPNYMRYHDRPSSRPDGGDGDRIDSFHVLDPRTNKHVPASHFGVLNPEYLPVDVSLEVAYTLLHSNECVKQDYQNNTLTRALHTLANAIRTMNAYPAGANLDAWATALASWNRNGSGGQVHPHNMGCPSSVEGLRDWVPNQFGGLNLPEGQESLRGMDFVLPPWFGTAGGLRTIRHATLTKTREHFERVYPFNYDMMLEVAKAVPIVETFFSTLHRVLPGNVGTDPMYQSSYLHGPHDAFSTGIENLLWRGIPVWLAKGAQPVAVVGGFQAIPARISPLEFHSALRTQIGLYDTEAATYDTAFLGRYTTAREITGDSRASTDLLFHPIQPGSAVAVHDRVDWQSMPDLAQIVLKDIAFDAVQVGSQQYYRYDPLKLAGGDPARQTYVSLMNLRHNITPDPLPEPITRETAYAFISSDVVRTQLLALLARVSMGVKTLSAAERTAAIVPRFQKLFNEFLTPQLGINPQILTERKRISDVTQVRDIRPALEAYLANDEAHKFIFGTRPVATVPKIMSDMKGIADRAIASKEGVDALLQRTGAREDLHKAAQDRVLLYNPNNYLRAPLVASSSQFREYADYYADHSRPRDEAARVPSYVMSDPENPDVQVNQAQQLAYANQIAAYINNPKSARGLPAVLIPSDHPFRSEGSRFVAAAANVRILRNPGSGVTGMTYAFETEATAERARRYEHRQRAETSRDSSRYIESKHAADDDMDIDTGTPSPSAPVRALIAPGLRDCMDGDLHHMFSLDTFATNWLRLLELVEADPCLAVAARAFLLTPTTGRAWRSFIQNDIYFPATYAVVPACLPAC
jgi:hypothetical protein